jgi:TRAP-type mannitol/chloroaromatic compound transport system permease large subunit
VLVEESIGRLYLAGFLPGFMLAGIFMVMIAIAALIWPNIAPKESEGQSMFDLQQWRERIVSLLALIPVAGLIFVVLGTIYMGIATPTEAAAFGVSGALVIGILLNADRIWQPVGALLLRKTGIANFLPENARIEVRQSTLAPLSEYTRVAKFTWEVMQAAFMSTIRTTGMIFLIILAAFTLSFAFARLGISQDIADAITGLNLNEITLVIVLVGFYLVLGTFMESFSMLVTTIPILVPTLEQVGVDLVWFGIIMVILVEAALISPPEGINLYVLHGVRQDITREMAEAAGEEAHQGTIADVWIGVLPFMACMGIALALIIAFPQIALWLPDVVKGERMGR